MQCGLTCMPLGTAQATTNYRLLCRTYQVALGRAHAATDLDLHQSPSQEAPEPTYPGSSFRPQESTTHLPPQMAHPQGGLGTYQILLKQIPLHGVSPCTAACPLWSWPHNQPAWGLIPPFDVLVAIKAQPEQKGTYNPHKGPSWNTQLR